MIDLQNGDKAAIAQFLKDQDIDPLDLNTTDTEEYKSNDHTVTEKELDLDLALDDIRDTKSFEQTLNIVSNDWEPWLGKGTESRSSLGEEGDSLYCSSKIVISIKYTSTPL